MKTMFKLFQFVGESELHIENLRQRLAKAESFESYNCFKKLGGQDSIKSQFGVNHQDIYDWICGRKLPETTAFSEKFTAEDVIHLVNFHSHNKDGYLSFTDFNQMVLPACNVKLRAEATQRANVFSLNASGPQEVDTSGAEERLV